MEKFTDRDAKAGAQGIEIIHFGKLVVGGDDVVDDVPIPGADQARTAEGERQALLAARQGLFGDDPVGGFVDDAERAQGQAVVVEQGAVVEVHPARFRLAVPVEDKLLIPQDQRLAAEAHGDLVAVEVGDFGPGLGGRQAKDLRVAGTGEVGIGVVVDEDAIGPDEHDHGGGCRHHHPHRALEAFRPGRNGSQRIGRPVVFVDQLEGRVLLKACPRLRAGRGKQGLGHARLSCRARRDAAICTILAEPATHDRKFGSTAARLYSPAARRWRGGFWAWTSSATRKASSRAWLALRRGSQ
jgi:hypothetical protein